MLREGAAGRGYTTAMTYQQNFIRTASGATVRTLLAIILIATYAYPTRATAQKACEKPLYLTFETGNMDAAPLVAEVLNRQKVKVTFFAANERTRVGDGSLGNHWAPWWKARAAEGHELASLTYDRVVWRGDVPGVEPRFRVQPTSGALEGREFTWDAKKYCEQIAYSAERLQDHTGKTSPRLLNVARGCGFEHAGWSATGALGDDLPSEKFSNEASLKKALKDIKPGDVLQAHLGSWSRKDPWAPAVLEPLIMGLKEKGFCFETLRTHPALKDRIAAAPK